MRWWERVVAWEQAHRTLVDAAIAVAVGVPVLVLATDLTTSQSGVGPVSVSLAMLIALIWRRTRPVASAVAVYGIALLHLLEGMVLVLPADLLVLVALSSVTVHGPVWAYRTALASTFVGAGLLVCVMALLQDDPAGALANGIVVCLLGSTVFALALVRRSRREALESLRDRARRLEVERDQGAQIATAAERSRIAREMHDIVAHSLSVIIAQADGGRYAAAQDPAAATRSLVTIGETGRAALADMRRLLGVLRPEVSTDGGRAGAAPGTVVRPGADGTAVADLVPQPAVGDIEQLVEQVRAAGVRVSLVRMGMARTLPPGTGLTVYRITQESLTNILKHAGPSPTATVLVQWAAAQLVVEVSDDGRGAAATGDGAGQGVLGMRERAAMLGGSLTVGPRPGGGYRVRAEIPIPPLEAQP